MTRLRSLFRATSVALLLAVALAPQFQAARFQNGDDLTRDLGASAAAVSSDPCAEATSVGLVGKSASDAEYCPKQAVLTINSDDVEGLKFSARRVHPTPLFALAASYTVTLQRLGVCWQV